MIFTDNSIVSNDTIVEYEWNFLGIGFKKGKEVKVVYDDINDQLTQLQVTTTKGCTVSKTESIAINNKPTADFTVEDSFGTPPFELTTTNLSSTSQKFYWIFDENNMSTETSPSHIYTELGTYTVQLIAESSLGCKDTMSKTIEVVDLYLDIVLHSINVLENEEGQWEIILDIENKSSFTLTNTTIKIDLGGDLTLFENISTLTPQERQKFYTLGFTLTKEKAERLDYICTELIPSTQIITESNLLDNEKCLTLQSDFQINSLFPNPTQNTFTVEYFIPTEGNVKIQLLNTIGDEFFNYNFIQSEGSHTQIIDVSTLQDGLYLLVLRYNSEEVVYKIVKD